MQAKNIITIIIIITSLLLLSCALLGWWQFSHKWLGNNTITMVAIQPQMAGKYIVWHDKDHVALYEIISGKLTKLRDLNVSEYPLN